MECCMDVTTWSKSGIGWKRTARGWNYRDKVRYEERWNYTTRDEATMESDDPAETSTRKVAFPGKKKGHKKKEDLHPIAFDRVV
ncbi:hypothetical protein RIF29_10449 [Crotalaria pallida]|uniref:Uncharacterized protein n=1 Tax=Crotalaria pallida TaxID=3830 RepID=A0AAN9FYY4_CROPI